MRLSKKQQLFTITMAHFISECYARFASVSQGFDGFTFGDTTGDIDDGRHKPKGNHYRRLAIDLNLFVNGEYVDGDHELWESIGELWESLDPLCRWGGRFRKRDYNHFSFIHNGVK